MKNQFNNRSQNKTVHLPARPDTRGTALLGTLLKNGCFSHPDSKIDNIQSAYACWASQATDMVSEGNLEYYLIKLSVDSFSSYSFTDLLHSKNYYPSIFPLKNLTEINALFTREIKADRKFQNAITPTGIKAVIEYLEFGQKLVKMSKQENLDLSKKEKLLNLLDEINRSLEVITADIMGLSPAYTEALQNEMLSDNTYDRKEILRHTPPPRLPGIRSVWEM